MLRHSKESEERFQQSTSVNASYGGIVISHKGTGFSRATRPYRYHCFSYQELGRHERVSGSSRAQNLSRPFWAIYNGGGYDIVTKLVGVRRMARSTHLAFKGKNIV